MLKIDKHTCIANTDVAGREKGVGCALANAFAELSAIGLAKSRRTNQMTRATNRILSLQDPSKSVGIMFSRNLETEVQRNIKLGKVAGT